MIRKYGFQSVALLCLTSILTACPQTIAPSNPNPPNSTAVVGLAVGLTNTLSCQDANGQTRNAPATAITLALRDPQGNPIGPNSPISVGINLTLSLPGGGKYIFKQPFNPTTAQDNELEASENYYVLCEPPVAGSYTLTGTVGTTSISKSAYLNNATPPTPSSRNTTLQVLSVNTAEVKWEPDPGTQAAFVNYYRGSFQGSSLRGYRVGFGSENNTPVQITPEPIEKPDREYSPVEVQTRQPQDDPTLSPTDSTIKPVSLSALTVVSSLTLPPHRTGRSLYIPMTFRTTQGSDLRAQAVDGTVTLNLLPGAAPNPTHVLGESYYAEIISSGVALGRATPPDSLSRNDLTVRYTNLASPQAGQGGPATARFSMSATQVANQGGLKDYTVFTTSLLAPDGWPVSQNAPLSISGPNGPIPQMSGFQYPAYASYSLAFLPQSVAAGNYSANFTVGNSSLGRTVDDFAFGADQVLRPPTTNLSLNPDLRGFSLELPASGPRSHWVYVYERGGNAPLVARRTCILSELPRSSSAAVCTIPRLPSAVLSNQKTYDYSVVSTETPLELYPLLNGNDWNFATSLRWTALRKTAQADLTVDLRSDKPSTPVGGTVQFTVRLSSKTSNPPTASLLENNTVIKTGLRDGDSFSRTYTSKGEFSYVLQATDGSNNATSAPPLLINVTDDVNQLASLEVVLERTDLLNGSTINLTARGKNSSGTEISLAGKSLNWQIYDPSRNGIVTLPPSTPSATNTLTSNGSDWGDLKLMVSSGSVTSPPSSRVLIWGMFCTGGTQGTGGTTGLCKGRNKDGNPLNITAVAMSANGWNSNSAFILPIKFNALAPVGGILGLTDAPTITGAYTFVAQVSGQTFRDTVFIDASNKLTSSIGNLQASGAPSNFTLSWNPATPRIQYIGSFVGPGNKGLSFLAVNGQMPIVGASPASGTNNWKVQGSSLGLSGDFSTAQPFNLDRGGTGVFCVYGGEVVGTGSCFPVDGGR